MQLEIVGLVVGVLSIVLSVVLFLITPIFGPKIAELWRSRSKNAIQNRLDNLQHELALTQDVTGYFLTASGILIDLAADVLSFFGILAGGMIDLGIIIVEIGAGRKPSPWLLAMTFVQFLAICVAALVSVFRLGRHLLPPETLQAEIDQLNLKLHGFDKTES